MMPIALGFDFDHTLGIDNGLEREAFYRYAAELGQPLHRGGHKTDARIDAVLSTVREGEVSIDDAIRKFFTHADGQVSGARWRAICFELVPELVEPIPGAKELLHTLRRCGVPFAILTNGWTPLQQLKVAQALGADAAPAVLVSDQIGALKPARAAFDALVDALHVERQYVWYVGDNPAGDVAGAQAAGLHAIWFDGDESRYPPKLAPPTRTFRALGELAAWVENTQVP